MNIEFKVDKTQTIKDINKIQYKLMPKVFARALDKLAFKSQDAVRKRMQRQYTLRNRKWMQGSVIINRSKENDFYIDRIHSKVISRFYAMNWHETGEDKYTLSGGRLAIPTKELMKLGARGGRGRIKKRWKPETLIKKYNESKSKKRKGRAKVKPFYTGNAIMYRKTKSSVVPLYIFKKRANIKKTFGFETTVNSYVINNYVKWFKEAETRILHV